MKCLPELVGTNQTGRNRPRECDTECLLPVRHQNLSRATSIDQGQRFGEMERDCEMKGCALSIVGSRPQAAPVRLHNGTTDSQSHAAALGLRRKKGGKYLVHSL